MLYALAGDAQNLSPDDAIERLSAEADRFVEAATKFVATETLHQTSDSGESHTVTSEYGFVVSSAGLREVRRVLSVDGKTRKKSTDANALALALATDSDADKQKLLHNFEKHRLRGVATDFGQLISLFAHGNTEKFEFSLLGRTSEAAGSVIFQFEQLGGSEALTIFEADKPVKQKLRGQVWVRIADGCPCRILLQSTHEDHGVQIRDVGTVDYAHGPSGVLLPAVVVHTQFRNGRVHVQDAFRYSEYREVLNRSLP